MPGKSSLTGSRSRTGYLESQSHLKVEPNEGRFGTRSQNWDIQFRRRNYVPESYLSSEAWWGRGARGVELGFTAPKAVEGGARRPLGS